MRPLFRSGGGKGAGRPGVRGRRHLLPLWLILALVLMGGRALPAPAQVEEINPGRGGEEIVQSSLPTPGKVTLIYFYSNFCPPCHWWGGVLEELSRKRPDLAVKKADINRPGVVGIDWKSSLVEQYKIRDVPHFLIFKASGELQAEGGEAARLVVEWGQQAGVIPKD